MSSFSHIIILGRQPELGLVELESLLGADGVEPFGRQAALVADAVDIDKLGGSLKIAEVLYHGESTPLRQLPIEPRDLPMQESKTPFAISAYGVRESAQMLKAAGLELKKQLKTRGSVRLVVPAKGLAVTAAELKHNQVIEHGFELLVVVSKDEMVIARTISVQDIDWYSKRDYDRPVRSAKVGMLPPKLAQILVNSTHADVVADPFCGTGVVLQEALLIGRRADGSDMSSDMVEASNANLRWLENEATQGVGSWNVTQSDAREEVLPVGCAVVSEGYLGPNLHQPPTNVDLAQMKVELRALYAASLSNWAKQLPSGAEVSICVPAWRVGDKWMYLGLVDELPRLGYTLKSFEHVRSVPLYARDDQIVGRQLLLLRKS